MSSRGTVIEVFGETVLRFTLAMTKHYNPEKLELTAECWKVIRDPFGKWLRGIKESHS